MKIKINLDYFSVASAGAVLSTQVPPGAPRPQAVQWLGTPEALSQPSEGGGGARARPWPWDQPADESPTITTLSDPDR